MVSTDDQAYIPRLYGRRQAKPLKKRQARLIEELLPQISINDAQGAPIDPLALFPGKKEIWFEIGFGGGEHLAALAVQNRDVGFIGAESFINGVGKLLVRIDDEKLENVRIRFDDARPVMEALPDHALSRLFVLFPDPWPKRRHYKRRIVSPWFFSEAARLLRPGGELRVASDIPDYVRWTLMHAQAATEFQWTADRRLDWAERPVDWPPTRYEDKALRAGRKPAYLSFRRI